jgi:hypothetical protein
VPSVHRRRLQARVGRDAPIVAWTRAWVSTDGRAHGLFAARTLDFAVLSTDALRLVTTGFFTRRPRRIVYEVPLDEVQVELLPARRGIDLRLTSRMHRPLRLQMRRHERAARFTDALAARTRKDASA